MDITVPCVSDDPIQTFLALEEEEEHPNEHHFDNCVTALKAEKDSSDEVAKQQTQLSAEEQQKLVSVLKKHGKLFSGKLGAYQGKKLFLDVDRKDVKQLRYQRPYPIPHANRDLFYEELMQLCDLARSPQTV